MKKSFNFRTAFIVSATILLSGGWVACNSDSKKSEDDEVAVTSSTVAVNSFSLKADKNAAASLDSVFFSIDLNNAVIFNADSLPKGANISKLVPVISFASTMSKAEIAVIGEQGDTIKKVNYLSNTTDSIDFSKKVVLNVTSFDKLNTIEYRLKVNVHQQNPDSIGWKKLEVAEMPSRLSDPLRSKSVLKNEVAYTLVEEADHSYSLCQATDVLNNEWEIKEITLPFQPDVESLVASASEFYILSDSDILYSSADGVSWNELAEGWKSIIGIYGENDVIGIKESGDEWRHVIYGATTENVGEVIPGDFPVRSRSSFVNVKNKWSEEPTGFFIGGVCRNGSISSATWAFDGNRWATLGSLPYRMEGASLVGYTMFRNTSSASKIKDFDAWLAIGGFNEENELNRSIFASFDNGVTWVSTNASMSLPEDFPQIADMSAFIINRQMNADLADDWTLVKRSATRGSYDIEGTEIYWNCPYIFLTGGYAADGKHSSDIWRGVLMRLNFTPII
ncbi:MAG: hypothetical protein K2H46_08385 [Muribaculaceae bacterium]|nr:hypothetical protein [Muribaculaceae bacterium]